MGQATEVAAGGKEGGMLSKVAESSHQSISNFAGNLPPRKGLDVAEPWVFPSLFLPADNLAQDSTNQLEEATGTSNVDMGMEGTRIKLCEI